MAQLNPTPDRAAPYGYATSINPPAHRSPFWVWLPAILGMPAPLMMLLMPMCADRAYFAAVFGLAAVAVLTLPFAWHTYTRNLARRDGLAALGMTFSSIAAALSTMALLLAAVSFFS